MEPDQTAYKRAASVSVIGLAIQLAASLTLLLYGLFGQDSTALTAFFYVLLGAPVWLTLALVSHQQRLARIEADEAALYASSSAAQASVFQEGAEDLKVHGRRLAWMRRFFVPVMSLAVGAALIGVGLWRYAVSLTPLGPEGFVPPEHTGWAVTVGLAVASVMFIFARFVAGMAKQEAWANLRSGAAVAVGAALVGLALAVGHAAAFGGATGVLRYLPAALAVFMVVLGAEIFLNQILIAYRPRRPGEAPRPAFESRILGFAAAPDRVAESVSEAINYQFGLNVSSTWFYKLLSRSLLALVLLGGLTTWGLTMLAVVEPNEKGLILQSGRLKAEVDSGAHLKWPWPFQTLDTFPAHRINEVHIGTPLHEHDDEEAQGPILWTEDHGVDEVYTIVRARPAGEGGDGESADVSLLSVEISVQFVVENLEAYQRLAADDLDADDPDRMRVDLLEAVASREVLTLLSARSAPELLGGARHEINQDIRSRLERRFAEMEAGVRLLFAGIIGVHPPHEEGVAESFEEVVSAEQRRQATIERATAEAIGTLAAVAGDSELAQRIVAELDELERMTASNSQSEEIAAQRQRIEDLIDEAGGEAASLLLQARADRWTKHMDVRGRAVRHAGRVAMYRAAPRVYLASLYLDALRDAVDDSRLFITTFDTPAVRMNFEEVQSGFGDIFEEQSAQEE